MIIKDALTQADTNEKRVMDPGVAALQGTGKINHENQTGFNYGLTVWEKVIAEFDGRPISGSFAVEQGMVKVATLKGRGATQVGVFNTTWLARYLLRELAAEGKA